MLHRTRAPRAAPAPSGGRVRSTWHVFLWFAVPALQAIAALRGRATTWRSIWRRRTPQAHQMVGSAAWTSASASSARRGAAGERRPGALRSAVLRWAVARLRAGHWRCGTCGLRGAAVRAPQEEGSPEKSVWRTGQHEFNSETSDGTWGFSQARPAVVRRCSAPPT